LIDSSSTALYDDHIMTTLKRRATKPAARIWNLRLDRRDRELLFLAASREEITQADFVRLALRERARRVLQGGTSA
jgi:uncharacterized protein (DUF1778 family)